MLSDLSVTGGAAVAADRIAHALHFGDTLVTRISSDGNKESPFSEKILFLGRKFHLFEQCVSILGKPEWSYNRRNKELMRQLDLILRQIQPDIINAHNLHSAFWPIELIDVALRHAPVVWTLHDCWSFLSTYYPSHSPNPDQRLKSNMVSFWERNSDKKNPKNDLLAVAPSRWIGEQALASYWKNSQVESIMYPISSQYTEKMDRNSAKKTLSLETESPVVLAVAGDLAEDRKGGEHLREIIENSTNQKIQFLLMGNGFESTNLPSNVTQLGFIRDEITKKILYAAADILIHTAPTDNLPNSVIESLSSGTPVLAFETGGLPDMVVPGQSGWIVKEFSYIAMLSKLHEVISTRSYLDLRESSQTLALKLFQSKRIGEQYQSLFKSIIA